MLKSEVIERIKDLPDDAEIVFALFTHTVLRGYHWRLLNQTIHRDGDPTNVISLSGDHTGISADTLQDMGDIAVELQGIGG